MDEEFDQVAAWAKRWDVPIICNEFGVFRKEARPEDRAAWISDVRKSLEKHGIWLDDVGLQRRIWSGDQA